MFDTDFTHAPSASHAGPGSAPAVLHEPVRLFSPGDEIYAEGDRSEAIFEVVFGMVRLYRLLPDGRRQICAFHSRGELFGFDFGTERQFFADAVTETGLRRVNSRASDVSRELLTVALRSLNRAHDHLLTVGRNDACGRVAAFLLEMAARQEARDSDLIHIPVSRADMADYLGLTIETVSRIITRFRQKRLVRFVSLRQLIVLDWHGLQDLTA